MPKGRGDGYARASKGTAGFYAELPPFSDFSRFTEERHYHPAPADWHVVVTDIAGSTRALAEGRYKDVNMLAAASIVAVTNAIGDVEIPFVFGGDGATLLIPDGEVPAVRTTLARLSRFAEMYFDLDLRVGLVAIADLAARGRTVSVARFRLSPGNYTALFSGGGIELAERLVKAPETRDVYSVEDPDATVEALDLSGLSCRWEPLPATHGVVLSLLIQARSDAAAGRNAAYDAVIGHLTALLGEAPYAGNPVTPAALRFRFPPRGLALEAAALAAGRPGWRLKLRLLKESFFQWLFNRFDLSGGGYSAPRYREELRTNSDYRRFDDTLRLVIDCDPGQADRIVDFLASMLEEGTIAYGTHRADAALMTCVVFSLEQSDHLHFLDGLGGGLTMASRELKAQLAA